MARQNLTEAGAHTEILERNSDGSMLIQVITPGWGSSGYYATEVLEAAGKAKVWPKGTHMYFDHPSASEAADRPERSVKDLAATLTEDARWDSSRKALIARAEPVGLGKTVFADEAFRKAVACSVRASAEMEIGEAEGRSGWIVEKIHGGTQNSVDFVTHAGRGGMILESARKALEEAGELDSDRREKFRNAVRDEYSADKVEVWVQDYDDTTVYFERWGGDDPGTFSQKYKETDDAIELTGDLVQVRAKTTYVPVDEAAKPLDLTREAAKTKIREARNVGQWIESRLHLCLTQLADDMYGNGKLTRDERLALSGAVGDALTSFTAAVQDGAPQLFQRDLWTDPDARVQAAEAHTPIVPRPPAGSNPTKEQTMPEIEESELQSLEEAKGRVPVLEAKVATEIARADQAELSLAQERAKTKAREVGTKRVREANSELPAATVEKIVNEAMREVPLTEAEKAGDRRLDIDAFGKQVDEARVNEETYLATVVEANGGTVRGLGQVAEKKEPTRSDSQRDIDEAWGRTPKQSQEA